jgi:hypothetical protein
MVGSVDLPYPAKIISASPAASEKSADEAARTASQTSPPVQTSPHVIKFHDRDGRTGILQWDVERIVYTGDLPAESGARGMFDSLWAKTYACQNGQLLAVSDKSTPAPQPLHFRADDTHSADVYLNSKDGAQYSGNLAVDSSAKPVFEALRKLYQCAVPIETTNQK